jgi:hypothetical protein
MAIPRLTLSGLGGASTTDSPPQSPQAARRQPAAAAPAASVAGAAQGSPAGLQIVDQNDQATISKLHVAGKKNEEGQILREGSHNLIGLIVDRLKASPNFEKYKSGELSVYFLLSKSFQFELGALKYFSNSVSKLIGKPSAGDC